MSSDRRRHLVRLAGRYDFHILADEVYQLVHFEHLPPPPLISFDEDSRVISFGSFSQDFARGGFTDPRLLSAGFQTPPSLSVEVASTTTPLP